MKKKEYISSTPEQTQKIAADVVSDMKKGGVIALYGDLGSGKTTFTQGVAKALHLNRHIQSPTFILMREYTLENSSVLKLYHLDLYRLESYETDELGLSHVFSETGALVIIEWAEKIKHMLPDRRIDISFEHVDEKKRKLTIEHH